LHYCTPEQLFMRRFAEETMVRALERHRAQKKDEEEFKNLQRFLPGPQLDIPDLQKEAQALRIPANRLAVRNFKLREKHRRVLSELVADTLDVDPDEAAGAAAIAQELRDLYSLLSDAPASGEVILEDA
jgi:hypothetical protein